MFWEENNWVGLLLATDKQVSEEDEPISYSNINIQENSLKIILLSTLSPLQINSKSKLNFYSKELNSS